MTTHEAKRDCAIRLHAFGVPFIKLTAKTIGFQDLARLDCVFVQVWLNGPLPTGITTTMIEQGIPKPSQGGYCVEYKRQLATSH